MKVLSVLPVERHAGVMKNIYFLYIFLGGRGFILERKGKQTGRMSDAAAKFSSVKIFYLLSLSQILSVKNE